MQDGFQILPVSRLYCTQILLILLMSFVNFEAVIKGVTPIRGMVSCACPGYGSCFVNFALVMGLLCGDLPQLWINVSNL